MSNKEAEIQKLVDEGRTREEAETIIRDLEALANLIFDIYKRKQAESYDNLKQITDEVYEALGRGEIIPWGKRAIAILEELKIKLRQDDGKLHSTTISIPKSAADAIVLGLRYIKKDGSYTEDHFLFRKGLPIRRCYKGDLEKLLPEYKGTHKHQLKEELGNTSE